MSRKGFYLRTIMGATFGLCGYLYAKMQEDTIKTDFVLANFKLFPLEVQKAFENNDFRYAHKYLDEVLGQEKQS